MVLLTNAHYMRRGLPREEQGLECLGKRRSTCQDDWLALSEEQAGVMVDIIPYSNGQAIRLVESEFCYSQPI